MNPPVRGYRYVGPPELRSTARPDTAGRVVRFADDLAAWPSERGTAESAEPFTFVVALDGLLPPPPLQWHASAPLLLPTSP